MLLQKLNQALDLLAALRTDGRIDGFALIGGLAVSAWSPPRATMDVDLLVLAKTENSLPSLIHPETGFLCALHGYSVSPV